MWVREIDDDEGRRLLRIIRRGTGSVEPIRIAMVYDNYSPHLTTRRCHRAADRAEADNVEIASTSTNSPWPNRIEARFTALRYFPVDGTDHADHKDHGSMMRRYIWRKSTHRTSACARWSTGRTLPDAAPGSTRRGLRTAW
ncbi:hypothetical protein GCM10010211_58140 [Streptomyces albospinus]|uniref:Transposase n=1 Tax=Streptomyces albospinus TaxID=285515 RepID=A0ABQ2VFX1_9ACTN|nr:hypothetical protein GCM10010211_58140 [Streptomyces albospinus]